MDDDRFCCPRAGSRASAETVEVLHAEEGRNCFSKKREGGPRRGSRRNGAPVLHLRRCSLGFFLRRPTSIAIRCANRTSPRWDPCFPSSNNEGALFG